MTCLVGIMLRSRYSSCVVLKSFCYNHVPQSLRGSNFLFEIPALRSDASTRFNSARSAIMSSFASLTRVLDTILDCFSIRARRCVHVQVHLFSDLLLLAHIRALRAQAR